MNRKRKRGEKNITGIEKETKSERDREREIRDEKKIRKSTEAIV